MAERLPSEPPVLPGFTFVRILGMGGFADVFLYEQNLPRRQVAVKVLLADAASAQLRSKFQAEANLMAQLSSHPSILTIYQAGVASDGRPYLVMEYCSSHLAASAKRRPLPVEKVLTLGVKIASALATAHRQGVLHRDIKPGNILTTAYGHPVLADFGIASVRGAVDPDGASGISVPWSAPEVLLGESSGSPASEIYSLAATLYTLLAGRAPFEQPGGKNTPSELIRRASRGRVPRIDRPDMPESFHRVLVQALARDPEDRPQSAELIASQLRTVETELGMTQTPLELPESGFAREELVDPEERTIIVAPRHNAEAGKKSPLPRAFFAPPGSSLPVGATVRSARRLTVILLALVVTLVVALAVVLTVLVTQNQTIDGIPTVRNISAQQVDDVVIFRWNNPGLQEQDSYRVKAGQQAPSFQRSNEFKVDAVPGERVCLTVTVVRDGRGGTQSNEKCFTTLL